MDSPRLQSQLEQQEWERVKAYVAEHGHKPDPDGHWHRQHHLNTTVAVRNRRASIKGRRQRQRAARRKQR